MGDQPQADLQSSSPAKNAQSELTVNSHFNKPAAKNHVPVVDIDSFSAAPQLPSQTKRQNQKPVASQNARCSDVTPRNLRSRDANGKYSKNSDKNSTVQGSNSNPKSKKSGSKPDVIRVNHRTIGKSNINNGNANGNRNQQGSNKRSLPKEPVNKSQRTLLYTLSPSKKAPPQIIEVEGTNKADKQEPKKETANKGQSQVKCFQNVSVAEILSHKKLTEDKCSKKEAGAHSVKAKEVPDKSLNVQILVVENSVNTMSSSPTIHDSGAMVLSSSTALIHTTTSDIEPNSEYASLVSSNGASASRKFYSMEADLGISATFPNHDFAQMIKCGNPKPPVPLVIENLLPKSSSIDFTQAKFENMNVELLKETEMTMNKLQADFDSKKKYIMFLPTAFKEFSESTICELYGRFNVRDVTAHYSKNGERIGSGTMRVTEDNTERVRNWASDRHWQALRMMPLRKRDIGRLGDDIVQIFFEFSFSWNEDRIENFLKKIREAYNATDIHAFYNYNGQCIRAGFAQMTYSTADKIEATALFSEILEPRYRFRMLEVVETVA